MRVVRRLAIVLFAFGLAGVGGSSPSATPSGRQFRVTVYFLTDGATAPLGVRRTVARRGSEPLARLALEQLLAGPSARDRAAGLTTAIPAGARIRSFAIRQLPRGSTATVDVGGLPSRRTAVTIARIGTQIARTIIGLSDVTRVHIDANGKPWNFWLMSGGVSTKPWDYQFLLGLWAGNFKALP